MLSGDRRWGALLIGVVLVLVIGLREAYFRFGGAGLQAVSIVATTVLTFALVVLYAQQHRVLRTQQEPQLEVNRVDVQGYLEVLRINISNYGGGPATGLAIRIDLYDIAGDGPLKTARGNLRRIEETTDGEEDLTRGAAVRPTEVSILFETRSSSVLSSGEPHVNQDSLASLVSDTLSDRDVVYGRIVVEYETVYSNENEHVADFSLQFTERDDIIWETMEFCPWEQTHEHHTLGG